MAKNDYTRYTNDESSPKFEKFRHKKKNREKFNDKGKHWKRDDKYKGGFDER